jgi:hypothetical protein
MTILPGGILFTCSVLAIILDEFRRRGRQSPST